MIRYRRYETPEEMATVIYNYFKSTSLKERTITGLALYLGVSKVTLLTYKKRKGFEDLVDWAYTMVENAYELDLRKYGGSANIFALRQFGWSDKQEISLVGDPDKPIVSKIVREVINITPSEKYADDKPAIELHEDMNYNDMVDVSDRELDKIVDDL